MNTLTSNERIALYDFVGEEYLQQLHCSGAASRDGCLLRLADGQLYALKPAVRILGTLSHETDPYGLIGTTDTIAAMLERGFVMSADGVALGRTTYAVEYGYLPQKADVDRASGLRHGDQLKSC